MLLRTVVFTGGDGLADDGARDAHRPPPDGARRLHAAADHDRPRARLGDAAGRGGEHLELDGRLRVRRRELDALASRASSYFDHHDWFVNPLEGFIVIGAIIVWGAIPFVTITLYAGLTQVPRDLVEAASIDGSNAVRIFRDITLPILKPIFVILREPLRDLELPDLQPDLDHPERPSRIGLLRDERLLVRDVVQPQRVRPRLGDRARDGDGDAGLTFVYIRQMVRIGEIE